MHMQRLQQPEFSFNQLINILQSTRQRKWSHSMVWFLNGLYLMTFFIRTISIILFLFQIYERWNHRGRWMHQQLTRFHSDGIAMNPMNARKHWQFSNIMAILAASISLQSHLPRLNAINSTFQCIINQLRFVMIHKSSIKM